MQIYLVKTLIGIFAVDDKNNIVLFKPFPYKRGDIITLYGSSTKVFATCTRRAHAAQKRV